MSKRQSNLELCRIIVIMMVVLEHANIMWSYGTWPTSTNQCVIPQLYIEAFCIVGVNVFVMITGFFSARPQLTSIFNLLYICLFYSIFRLTCGAIFGHFNITDVFFISKSNWYIVSYLGLLFLSPLLNLFIDSVDKKKLKGVLIFLLVYNVYYGWLPRLNLDPGVNYGYSVLSFITLYILARYIRLYGDIVLICKYSIPVYLLCTCIIGTLGYLALRYHPSIQTMATVYAYSNPVIILSSVSVFTFF